MKLSAGMLRVLIAVKAGQVSQVFDQRGNVFRVPTGCSPGLARKAQDMRLIEDVPAKRVSRYTQRLTQKGEAALKIASGECAYPDCTCIVSTSSTAPAPKCPKGLTQ